MYFSYFVIAGASLYYTDFDKGAILCADMGTDEKFIPGQKKYNTFEIYWVIYIQVYLILASIAYHLVIFMIIKHQAEKIEQEKIHKAAKKGWNLIGKKAFAGNLSNAVSNIQQSNDDDNYTKVE